MSRYLNLINNVSNWHLHFMNKFGLINDDTLLFIAKRNIRIETPKRLHHEFKEIFMENAYTVGMKKKLKRNPIIIDIGANVGFFTLFAVSKYPNCTIYSFEPIYSNFQQLIKNRDLNKTKNIHCFNKAVCGYSGTVKMTFDPTDSYTTSASINIDGNKESLDVPCLTLSDIFIENKIDHCDLLKMDCEGAEFDILYNTSKDFLYKIDQMAIEVHTGKNEKENLSSLKDFLIKSDFKLFQFEDKQHMLWAYRN